MTTMDVLYFVLVMVSVRPFDSCSDKPSSDIGFTAHSARRTNDHTLHCFPELHCGGHVLYYYHHAHDELLR